MAAGPSTARSTVQEAGTRATLSKSRWSVGGGWRTGPPGWVRAAAAALAAERPGRPGRRAEPVAAAARWARVQAAARGGYTAAWLPSSGWVRDHGGWSSPRLTPGWAAPEGPLDVPTGIGVRPQRGPGRPRARPARCRQRSDLRRWGWACQDLNLGPHPYQQSRAHRCATLRFRRWCATVEGEVMRSYVPARPAHGQDTAPRDKLEDQPVAGK